jgi:hypothetical protein
MRLPCGRWSRRETASFTMPRDVTEPSDHETGFGTGLRPRLERRRGGPSEEAEAAVADEAAPEETEAEAQAEGERSEADELWAELEAARERETGLRKALAEYSQLQTRAVELEQALAVREAELAELRAVVDEETRPEQDESARQYLRRQAEQHADLLWRSFQDGLTALQSDGSADFRVRLEAARALLSEAYPESAPPERRALTPEEKAAQDELASARARRANQQPSS